MQSIYKHKDYRSYLKEKYLEIKARNSSFTLNAFSQYLGFASKNALSLILTEKRELSVDMLFAISEKFGLSESEKQYFIGLLLLSRAKEPRAEQALETWLAGFRRGASVEVSAKPMSDPLETIREVKEARSSSVNLYAKPQTVAELQSYFHSALELSLQALDEAPEDQDFVFNVFSIPVDKKEEFRDILRTTLIRLRGLGNTDDPNKICMGLNLQLLNLDTLISDRSISKD